MKSDYISRSALEKRLTLLAVTGKDSQQRTFAKCINEVGLAPDAMMWIDAKWELPVSNTGEVLAIVNGTYKNIRFEDACMLAEFDGDEGWIIEGYEEWEDAEVSWWMPLPELPKEE